MNEIKGLHDQLITDYIISCNYFRFVDAFLEKKKKRKETLLFFQFQSILSLREIHSL